jgi:hypothetical protein
LISMEGYEFRRTNEFNQCFKSIDWNLQNIKSWLSWVICSY